ncbi:hypothetical protein KEM54_005010 [Ascosphaera aggregata]|nr:hypothetical protein KEM54_005010 [Ascosphaera aggregata]
MNKRTAVDDSNGAPDSPASKRVRLDDGVANSTTQFTLPKLSAEGSDGQVDRSQGDALARDSVYDKAGNDEGALSDSGEDDTPVLTAPTRQAAPTEGYSDLYLDTIQRSVLDFDFEKLCSVSLSNINVYACLVCGKYFQGRGPKSHAYFHALYAGHHVYINMETKRVYVLPEGYEVKNKSLDDIKYVVDPHYSEEEVARLDKVVIDGWDITGKRYRPGFVGMNNIKANDYLNVIVQLLAHVRPIRNFFLLHHFAPQSTSQLPIRFGTLVRKLWNAKAFRNHVSPHELLQEVALRSSKKFTLTRQSDPVEFLSWFLNELHVALGGSRRPTGKPTSVIQSTFQGHLKIESQAITAYSDATNSRLVFSESSVTETQKTPFLFLTLDLPPTPLFQSSNAEYIIPQVSLTTLLNKYNGVTASERLDRRLRHRLMHPLPPYILFHIKRFSKNKFISERNPTIVTFPSHRGLDLSPYVEPNPSFYQPSEPILYDLVANIILDADVVVPGGAEGSRSAQSTKGLTGAGVSSSVKTAPGAGAGNDRVSWRIQLQDKATSAENSREKQQKGPEWLEIQDLFVERTESETLFTKEGYLMVWERQKSPLKKSTGSKSA